MGERFIQTYESMIKIKSDVFNAYLKIYADDTFSDLSEDVANIFNELLKFELKYSNKYEELNGDKNI